MLSFIIMKTACTLKNDEKMSATKTKGVTKRKGDKVEDRGDKKRSKMSDASDDSNVKQSNNVAALEKEVIEKSLEKWLVPRKRLMV